mmetsp:Transcript_31249/g.50382  ORF Transcript_31249/g.50382 Transcript_31249/m.50382 type:complete len:242 (-) Transcript_31249:173-898(-)
MGNFLGAQKTELVEHSLAQGEVVDIRVRVMVSAGGDVAAAEALRHRLVQLQPRVTLQRILPQRVILEMFLKAPVEIVEDLLKDVGGSWHVEIRGDDIEMPGPSGYPSQGIPGILCRCFRLGLQDDHFSWYSGAHEHLPHLKGFSGPHARGIPTRDDDAGDFPFLQQILRLQCPIQQDLWWFPVRSQGLAQHHSHALGRSWLNIGHPRRDAILGVPVHLGGSPGALQKAATADPSCAGGYRS